ncbi:cation diffusion facilitator family transporter [Clostridium perfringens]|uniref:cation diffusion facilitator family transporter n=1 Tax=Clostridium perfringens TaxID=1502 RepID=UPI001E484675|nr:cation diffusion facilitator family transporter [Clostridium perfringens]MCC5434203.1 cation diffusion facilitator family transporter [Clostridium perfringens]MCC5436739.1 cation diffusion facilitator family transporter [Clostridium perfringens]
MFSNLIIKTFIKDYKNTENESVRISYGYLASIVGIIVNIILFLIKFSVGLISASIAITADAFNNLSDAGSSVITMIGFKLAKMPADKEHPFGHGRIEYISALIVAFMVMLVGFQFTKSSIERILNPTPVTFEVIPFILLVVSIFFKFWLSRFNKLTGNRINSSALKAASVDALGDVFTSTCVVISFLAAKFTTFPIDGYIGVIVSLAILYAGFTLVKETINPLLGEAPDPELAKNIREMVLSYDHIIGVHDLIIHNYGVGKCMASIHAEIPSDINVMKIHDIIDMAEREISNKLKIYLVIHMDPICLEDGEIKQAKEEIDKIIKYNPLIESMHDFRIVGHGNKKNLIFDIVVNPEKLRKVMSESELKEEIIKAVKETHPQYNCIITIDKDFTC